MSAKKNYIFAIVCGVICIVILSISSISQSLGFEFSVVATSLISAFTLATAIFGASTALKSIDAPFNVLRKEVGVNPSPTDKNDLEEIASIVKSLKDEISRLEQKASAAEKKASEKENNTDNAELDKLRQHLNNANNEISALKSSIDELSNEIFWLEGILDSIPFPLSVTDNKMNWTFINRPVEKMLNLKRADVLGKPCNNWGANICNTSNCGIACLKSGKKTTLFDQMGMNFQVDVDYLYDASGNRIGHIEIVQDITKMVSTQNAQNEMVHGLTNTSETFVVAVKNIAEGSQSLAVGAHDQAESIDKLSVALSQVSQNAEANMGMAEKSAQLAETIKLNAEKGSQRMSQMIQAVTEINEASKSISKVIKDIEDISFQTSILALNASIESARAGAFGRGFAVVAGEVRSLAAKSAESVQSTASLITNSLEKAEMGVKIAGETAASFSEIVDGINESTQIAETISHSSRDQTNSIVQINHDIDQVAQIVQQNNATAEESAAASQELSAQTEVLRHLIEQFGSLK